MAIALTSVTLVVPERADKRNNLGVLQAAMKKQKKRTRKKKINIPRPTKRFDWDVLLAPIALITALVVPLLFKDRSVIWALIFGFFLVLLALPIAEPERYKPRPLLHGVVGASIGSSLAFTRLASLEIFILYAIGGFVMGFFGMNWVKHL